MAKSDDICIVDVRDRTKYKEAFIPGSVNVPLFQPIQGWDLYKIARRVQFAVFGVQGVRKGRPLLHGVQGMGSRRSPLVFRPHVKYRGGGGRGAVRFTLSVLCLAFRLGNGAGLGTGDPSHVPCITPCSPVSSASVVGGRLVRTDASYLSGTVLIMPTRSVFRARIHCCLICVH